MSLGNNVQVCYVTYTTQGFTTKAIGGNRLQIFELAKFGRRETLADDLEVIKTNTGAIILYL